MKLVNGLQRLWISTQAANALSVKLNSEGTIVLGKVAHIGGHFSFHFVYRSGLSVCSLSHGLYCLDFLRFSAFRTMQWRHNAGHDSGACEGSLTALDSLFSNDSCLLKVTQGHSHLEPALLQLMTLLGEVLVVSLLEHRS